MPENIETITIEEMAAISGKTRLALRTIRQKRPERFPTLIKTTPSKTGKGKTCHYDKAEFMRMINKTSNKISNDLAVQFITKPNIK